MGPPGGGLGGEEPDLSAFGAADAPYPGAAKTVTFVLVRYNPGGSLEPTFGNGGMGTTPVRSGGEEASAGAI